VGSQKKSNPIQKSKKPLVPKTIQTPPMAKVDYFERKLDDKRRLTIPAEVRDEFASGVVVTRGFKQYLHLYPKAVWDQVVEKRLEGDILSEEIADLNVQFRMGKTEGEVDAKQGRISIEQHLLDYAGIDKGISAVRVGQYWRLMASA
jgi:MraZ protein